jgi:hypothetical protein
VEGGVWKLRNNAEASVSLWVAGRRVIAEVTPPPQSATCNSSRVCPLQRLLRSAGTAGTLQGIPVRAGDEVYLAVDGNDFVGFDLRITDGDEVWDLAEGFSDQENPSGPWAWGEVVVGEGGGPSLQLFEHHEADYDEPDMGMGQPAWVGSGPHWYRSLMRSRGTVKGNPFVRMTSDLTVCVEASAGQDWVSRFWSTNGRRELAYGLMAEPAFGLEIDGNPVADCWECLGVEDVPPETQGERHVVVRLQARDLAP